MPARDPAKRTREVVSKRAIAAAAGAHALLIALANPPFGAGFFALVTPLPLVWLACASVSRRGWAGMAPVLITPACTLPLWLFQYTWIFTNASGVSYPLLSAYMAIWAGLTVWVVRAAARTSHRVPLAISVPLAWMAMEIVRGEVMFGGYPWYLTAQPLADAYVLAAPAASIGTYGLGGLIAALCGAVGDAAGWTGRRRPRAALSGAVIVAVWAALSGVGYAVSRSDDDRRIRVGVVQTAVPQDIKQMGTVEQLRQEFADGLQRTRDVAAQRPDVIVWPETMLQAWCLNLDAVNEARRLGWQIYYVDEFLALQRQIGIPMLVGAIAREDVREVDGQLDSERLYNSVFVVEDGRPGERYDKISLTPFGERIPLLWRWDELQQAVVSLGARGMEFRLSAGERMAPIRLPDGTTVATPVCFEVTKAHLCRRLVCDGGTRRAGLLVNPSNDAWFGAAPGGRAQHLLTARWRAIELATPMVRSVNTGISANIDRRGFIKDRGPDGRHADRDSGANLIFDVELAPLTRCTPYARFGYLLEWVVPMIAGLLLALSRTRRLRSPDAWHVKEDHR